MLHDITPVVLTYNEEANIGRTLAALAWAREVVVVDSGSTDATVSIVASVRNARLVIRPFDSHAAQWNFATHETGISTGWVLALDADYLVGPALVDELARLHPAADVHGYVARFTYAVHGIELPASVYPPLTVLFRPDCGRYQQDGHTQRLVVTGRCEELQTPLVHDDRKTLDRWLNAQTAYAKCEVRKLQESGRGRLSWFDRVRTWKFCAPFLMFVYCLVFKRAALRGKNGLFYAFQRMTAESILSLLLLEADVTGTSHTDSDPPRSR